MSILKVCIASAALSLSLAGVGIGTAAADPAVIVEPPVFYPHADFRFEDGYYRSHDGHYYHYDRDREGWHIGRNHREGLRWEESHRRRR